MPHQRDEKGAAAMDKSCVRLSVYHLATPDSYWPDNAVTGFACLYIERIIPSPHCLANKNLAKLSDKQPHGHKNCP